MGSADVIPLIPVMNTTKDECIELSRRLGRNRRGTVDTVYLYEDSATSPNGQSFEHMAGEFENFNPDHPEAWKPDFGPSSVHPSAGVVAVGCRNTFIAFNVNLGTDNIEIANKIAKAKTHKRRLSLCQSLKSDREEA